MPSGLMCLPVYMPNWYTKLESRRSDIQYVHTCICFANRRKLSLMPYKFSGHETFPFRYTWLPKAYRLLRIDATALGDEENAMVELGVGKNMVRAIRFWILATGIAEPAESNGYRITEFGERLLGTEGHDPYLEDVRTLWLLHWKLSTQVDEPLFAWDYMLNHWQHPEISRTEVIRTLGQEVAKMERPVSQVTLAQHFDIFLHTYVSTNSSNAIHQEDSLDCPLVELELIQCVGERKLDESGKRERIYAFRRDEKPDIKPEVFVFCLNDYWMTRRGNEQTLTFRDVSVAKGSIGQVFKLPEQDLRERLANIEDSSQGLFTFKESAFQPYIERQIDCEFCLLDYVYRREEAYV